jgi:mRNA-degrading endonuclease RelE of RelBE toxin-antitoxin system
MYLIEIKPNANKKIAKLKKKNFNRYLILKKKIFEIISNPKKYKNLKGDKFGLCRVHIDKSFVLTFSINHFKEIVIIDDFDHHDKIYKK